MQWLPTEPFVRRLAEEICVDNSDSIHKHFCPLLLQIVNSRAFAAGRQKGDGADQEEWRFCAPLLDMLDHGGPCKSPIQDSVVRQDNVRSALLASQLLITTHPET